MATHLNSEKTGLSINLVSVSVTNPTKSDFKVKLEILTYPSFVSNIKMNGKDTLIGSSAIELTTTSDVEFTWDNATTLKPEMFRIEVLSRWLCEINTKNPLNSNATYSSAGLPTLTVK
jgi:hypothetical protein